MTRTVVRVSRHRYKRQLDVHMLFDREVETADVRRCGRAFAQALNTVFTAQGVLLGRVNFQDGLDLPQDHDEYPYNLTGSAARLKGDITSSQYREFSDEFARLLKATGHYTVVYQRRSLPKVRRTSR